jgi:hypothetical protein
MKKILRVLTFILFVFTTLRSQENLIFEESYKLAPNQVFNEICNRNFINLNNIYIDPISSVSPDLSNYSNDSLFFFFDKYYEIQTIWFTDNRKNFYKVSDPFRNDAEKVCCFVDASRVKNYHNGTYELNPVGIYGVIDSLDPREMFYQEPVASFCTGFAVGNDKIVTVKHGVYGRNPNSFICIFGFKVNENGEVNTTILEKDVIYVNSIIPSPNLDFVIIRTNKNIAPHRIETRLLSEQLSDNALLHIVGFPRGLPIKIADEGTVKFNDRGNYFYAKIDAFKGNSGSPIYNSITHVVEGILLSGDDDFPPDLPMRSGKVLFRCPNDIYQGTCKGERILRIKEINKFIKAIR